MTENAERTPESDETMSERRQWPRHAVEGTVSFHRPHEKQVHTGVLVDVSEGGLAFLTDVSLAVGETLLMSYQVTDLERSSEGMVETVHSHPKNDQFLIGTRFVGG